MISEDVITIFLRLSDFFPIAIFFHPGCGLERGEVGRPDILIQNFP